MQDGLDDINSIARSETVFGPEASQLERAAGGN
jgi:hypothetical protein